MKNNKGMTIVELVISFALLMVIVLGMLGVIVNIKNTANEKMFQKDMLEFKDMITNKINKDLIKNGFNSIENCADVLSGELCKIIVLNDEDATEKELRVSYTNKTIKYGDTIYDIPRTAFINFVSSASQQIKIEGDYFIINIEYNEIDKDINYGFKINHPIGLIEV